MTDHLASIKAGVVNATTIIGLRKSINADERRRRGLSVSRVAPKLKGRDLANVERALAKAEPRVEGKWHNTGLKLLQSPRYRKRLAPVADIVANLDSFHLVGYQRINPFSSVPTAVPVFRARAGRKSFLFRNIPWQAHGNGPELLESL